MKTIRIAHRLAFGASLFLLAAVLAPRGARAADSADALVEKGRESMRVGRFQDALDSFARARNLTHSAVPVAQEGLAEQALSQWAAAEGHLQEALAMDDTFVKKNRQELEEALKFVRTHLGTLQISGNPEGTVVKVNGSSVATLPMREPLSLPVGKISILLRAPAPGLTCDKAEAEIKVGTKTQLELGCKPNDTIASESSAASVGNTPVKLSQSSTELAMAPRSTEALASMVATGDSPAWGAAAAGSGLFFGAGVSALVLGAFVEHDGDNRGRWGVRGGGVALGLAVALFYVWENRPDHPAAASHRAAIAPTGLQVTF